MLNVAYLKPALKAVGVRSSLVDEVSEAICKQEDALRYMGFTTESLACLLAQCSVESKAFSDLEEDLWYTAERIMVVWPKRFKTLAAAKKVAENPKALAIAVYTRKSLGNRRGTEDGWDYRGRGYIQLTGRNNYRHYGELLGIDLLNNPELAGDPTIALLIAAAYFANRAAGRSGTILAKANTLTLSKLSSIVTSITKAVNGGTHGLSKRTKFTKAAYIALINEPLAVRVEGLYKEGDKGDNVKIIQQLLRDAGYKLGVDGDFGPGTKRVVVSFQQDSGLLADGIVGSRSLDVLYTLAS